jgi:deazaflavin-dependent oxidoreductase (nitroreductase family)
MQKTISIRPVAWLLSHTIHHLDRYLILATNGRYSAANILTGLPTICLTTTGAKSGQPRTVPLLGIPEGDRIILIASNWGQSHHPGWYYNIRVNPDVEVTLNDACEVYVARITSGEERRRCWETAVRLYPGYASYKKWTAGREIPVIILEKHNKDEG